MSQCGRCFAKKGKVTDGVIHDKLEEYETGLNDVPLHICDDADMSIDTLTSYCHEHPRKRPSY